MVAVRVLCDQIAQRVQHGPRGQRQCRIVRETVPTGVMQRVRRAGGLRGCSPRTRRSRNAASSGCDTVHTTVLGRSPKVPREGLPLTGEAHISCRCHAG